MSKLSEARENSARDLAFIEEMRKQKLFIEAVDEALFKPEPMQVRLVDLETVAGRILTNRLFLQSEKAQALREEVMNVLKSYLSRLKAEYRSEAGEAWDADETATEGKG
jgi:hypothetical protein